MPLNMGILIVGAVGAYVLSKRGPSATALMGLGGPTAAQAGLDELSADEDIGLAPAPRVQAPTINNAPSQPIDQPQGGNLDRSFILPDVFDGGSPIVAASLEVDSDNQFFFQFAEGLDVKQTLKETGGFVFVAEGGGINQNFGGFSTNLNTGTLQAYLGGFDNVNEFQEAFQDE